MEMSKKHHQRCNKCGLFSGSTHKCRTSYSLSQETKDKIGVRNGGSNSGLWKGGISRAFYKKKVFERDDWTCRICGIRDIEIMEVDHLIPSSIRPDLKSMMENLQTLCANCHRRKTNRELRASLRLGLWQK